MATRENDTDKEEETTESKEPLKTAFKELSNVDGEDLDSVQGGVSSGSNPNPSASRPIWPFSGNLPNITGQFGWRRRR